MAYSKTTLATLKIQTTYFLLRIVNPLACHNSMTYKKTNLYFNVYLIKHAAYPSKQPIDSICAVCENKFITPNDLNL